MKISIPLLIAIFTLLGGLPSSIKAQISTNEESISAIAIQCAMSSGYPASNFGDYATGLAKTLALLSADQQKRIFGYLPNPPVGALANSDSPVGLNGEPGNTEELNSPIEDPGMLTNLVGRFNSAFDGSASTPPALIGTTPPAETPSSGDLSYSAPAAAGAEGDNSGTSDSIAGPAASEPVVADAGASSSDYWQQFLNFIKEVDEGYKEGGVGRATEVFFEAASGITETENTVK